ncbi:MAG: general secretion pathway protein GspK [Sumerlaeia bacterium]
MIVCSSWRSGNSQHKRGIMLILVLWIVTILSLLMYSLLFTLTLETRITSVRKRSQQAEGIARAGIAKGFVDLRNDLIADYSGDEIQPFDAEGDFWADPDEGKLDEEFGDGFYNVEIIDNDRFFSLRSISPTNRILLEKIIEEIGYNEEDAKITASAIIDFADADDRPVLDSATGTEGVAYGILMAEDAGERVREDDVVEAVFPNEPYITVETLLEVYGVTPELYFGPGTPEAAYYRKAMGMEESRRKRRSDRFQIEDRRRDAEEIFGLKDYFTVESSGSLNLNTAPKHVLTALFIAAGRDDGDRAAEDVIRFRRGGKSRRIDNSSAFKSMEDFAKSGTLASFLNPMQALHPITVRSTSFNVRSTGTIYGVNKTLEVIVTRELTQVQRVEDFEYLDRARDRRERFREQRERWEDKDNEQLLRIPSIYIKRWKVN